MRKAITASLVTLLCAAAGAVPFAAGGSDPAKPAHVHPATHPGGTPKAIAAIIAEARLATAKYATSLEAARKAGYTVNVTRMIPDMGWHFLNPKISGFDPNKPPILVYEKRGKAWQLAAFEWVFTEKPAKAPLPGAKYGAFPAACHYADGTFVAAAAEADCAKTSPESGAAFGFWHPDFVTLHVWAWYPNPDGVYAGMNPLVRPFNEG
ncbi:MAG: hypothetical protein QOF45_667 [Gaiellaceae bacterium]|nr:hypothetical protein [Gaiellaceae bacterium]